MLLRLSGTVRRINQKGMTDHEVCFFVAITERIEMKTESIVRHCTKVRAGGLTRGKFQRTQTDHTVSSYTGNTSKEDKCIVTAPEAISEAAP